MERVAQRRECREKGHLNECDKRKREDVLDFGARHVPSPNLVGSVVPGTTCSLTTIVIISLYFLAVTASRYWTSRK